MCGRPTWNCPCVYTKLSGHCRNNPPWQIAHSDHPKLLPMYTKIEITPLGNGWRCNLNSGTQKQGYKLILLAHGSIRPTGGITMGTVHVTLKRTSVHRVWFFVFSVKLVWLQQLFTSATSSAEALKIPKMAVVLCQRFSSCCTNHSQLLAEIRFALNGLAKNKRNSWAQQSFVHSKCMKQNQRCSYVDGRGLRLWLSWVICILHVEQVFVIYQIWGQQRFLILFTNDSSDVFSDSVLQRYRINHWWRTLRCKVLWTAIRIYSFYWYDGWGGNGRFSPTQGKWCELKRFPTACWLKC